MQDPVMLQDASVTSVSLKSCHPREFQRSNRSNCRNDAQIGMTRGQDSQDLYIVKNKYMFGLQNLCKKHYVEIFGNTHTDQEGHCKPVSSAGQKSCCPCCNFRLLREQR